MALGFGSTFGSGTTDKLTSLNNFTCPTTVSVAFLTNRNADNAALASRVITQETGSHIFLIQTNGVSSIEEVLFPWTTTDGRWSITRPGTGVWTHNLIVYDGGSTTNTPTWYVNGSAVSVSTLVTPVGTPFNPPTEALVLGNRPAGDRVFDGRFAEFAIWNRLLTAAEAVGLGLRGMSPLAYSNGLVEYIPMVRNPFSRKNSGAFTAVGPPLPQPHPRVIYPIDVRVTAPTSGGIHRITTPIGLGIFRS